MIKLGANILSQTVQRNLARSTSDLSRSSERLASGQRINRASDDAAGLAISMSLDKDRILTQTARRNVSDGISMVSIMSSGLRSQKGILFRMAELAEQSANGTYSSQQREVLQKEYSSLMDEFDRVADATEFNGIKLLRNTASQTIQFMAGITGADTSLLQVAAANSHRYAGVLAQRSDVALGYNSAMPIFSNTGRVNSADVSVYTSMLVMTPDVFNDQPSPESPPANPLLYTALSDPNIQDYGIINFLASDGSPGEFRFLLSRVISDSSFGQLANLPTNAQQQHIQYAASKAGEGTLTNAIGLTTSAGRPSNSSISISLSFGSGAVAQISLDLSGTTYESYDLNRAAASSVIGYSHITNRYSARRAVVIVGNRINDLSQIEGQFGAVESRLQVAHSLLSTSGENFAAASSRIKDADFAAESANTVRSQILQQTAASLLGQANQAPQLALRLLQG